MAENICLILSNFFHIGLDDNYYPDGTRKLNRRKFDHGKCRQEIFHRQPIYCQKISLPEHFTLWEFHHLEISPPGNLTTNLTTEKLVIRKFHCLNIFIFLYHKMTQKTLSVFDIRFWLKNLTLYSTQALLNGARSTNRMLLLLIC